MKKEIWFVGVLAGLPVSASAHADDGKIDNKPFKESKSEDVRDESSFVESMADLFGINAVLKEINEMSSGAQEVGPDN